MGNRATRYSSSTGIYTVVQNDTLWWICSDLLSQIRNASGQSGMTVNQAMSWVASKNNMASINEYLYVGQKLAIHAAASSSSTAPTTKISNSPIITYFGRAIPIPPDVETSDPATSGVTLDDRSLLAIWTWGKETNTASYEYVWKYTNGLVDNTGKTIWLEETGSNSIDDEHSSDRNYLDAARQATWEIPEGATYVQFIVSAVSRTYKSNGKDTTYFSKATTTSELFDVRNISLPKPSAPSVSMVGQLQLRCTASNINQMAKKIQFEIWRNGTERFNSAITDINNVYTSTYSCSLIRSSYYNVRCRISNGVVWSDWSDFEPADDSLKTVSAAPEITTLNVEPQTVGNTATYVINVGWTKCETADDYVLEWILKEACTGLDQNGDYLPVGSAQSNTFSVVNGVHPTATTIPANSFGSSGEYYVHMRTTSNSVASEWSKTRVVRAGTRPNPPTTWASNNVTIIDQDNLSLFWSYNPTDDSFERQTAIYWSFGMAGPDGEVIWDAWSRVDQGTTLIIKNNRTGAKRYELGEVQILLSQEGTEQNDITDAGPARRRLVRGNGKTYLRWAARSLGAYTSNTVADDYGYSENSTIRTVRLYHMPVVTFGMYRIVVIGGEEEVYDALDDEIPNYPFYIVVHNDTVYETQEAITYYVKVTSNESYTDADEFGNIHTVLAGDAVYENIVNSDSFELDPILRDGTRFVFDASNINLRNGVSYTFSVEMTTDAGLKATYEKTLTAAFEEINLFPNAEMSVNTSNITMSIKPYCLDEDGDVVDSVYLSVYRREFDGSFTEIASNIDAANGLFVVDPHPALNYARYRIIAKDKTTGQRVWYDLPGYPIGIPVIIIQWDEAWQPYENDSPDPLYEPEYIGSMVRLPYNIDVSESTDRDIALVDYIGRENPVSYYGTKIGATGSWSTDISKSDTETIYALRRLARWMGDAYVREPSGIGYWATVKVSFSQTHNEVTIPVSIEVTKVEGGA